MGRALIVINAEADREKCAEWARKAPWGTRVEWKASKRSLPQNDLFWSLLTEVSQQITHAGNRYDPSEWKLLFLHAFGREIQFLPGLDGKTFLPVGQSSSDLSKEEMTELIEFILSWGAQNGVVFREQHNDNSNSGSDPSPEPDDASGPASEGGEVPPASSPSPICQSDLDWLVIVAKMLWAATPNTGQTEDNLHLLNAQRLAIPVPEEVSRLARDKAGSIYARCKQTLMGEHPRAETLKYIAGVAGCEEKQIGAAS